MRARTQLSPFPGYGVLVGLHYQKLGQYRSLQKVTMIMGGLLLFIMLIAVGVSWSDGGQKPNRLTYRVAMASYGRAAGIPPSLSDFTIGYVGAVSIVNDANKTDVPPGVIPDSGVVSSPVPGSFSLRSDLYLKPIAFDTSLDLSNPPPPMSAFLCDRTPIGMGLDVILLGATRLAHVTLVNPSWPPNVWLADDTAVVEGVVTLRADGLISFELRRDSHVLEGFTDQVRVALAHSSCLPALDSTGQAISVRYRYRCTFFEGARPSIDHGVGITAHLQREK